MESPWAIHTDRDSDGVVIKVLDSAFGEQSSVGRQGKIDLLASRLK